MVSTRSTRAGQHDYVSRARRIEVLQSSADRYLCRLAWTAEEFEINDTAFAVLSLCNGRRTFCALLLELQAALGLSAAEMESIQHDVKDTLSEFARNGFVRFSPAPGESAGIVVTDNPVPATGDAAPVFPGSVQVINLSYRTDRWQAISSALEACGAPGYQRLEAVDAELYPSVDAMLEAFGFRLAPCYLEVTGYDGVSHRFKAKTGCALSHRRALQNIVASGVVGWHVIFEDDDTPLRDWAWLLDSFADTLARDSRTPDVVLLSEKVGIAQPVTGIDGRFGCDAYAVHSSACPGLIDSIDFSTGAFHIDYSLDNHFWHLCEAGRLDITVLANGPWAASNTGHRGSDIEH